MMYLDHFGLRTDPFPLYPSLKFVFMSTAFEEAMAHLAYGLEHEEDIILITGPIGTGKTLALQSLLSNLGKFYRTAFVNVTQLDYVEILKLILADLGAPVTGPADRGDLLGALKDQVRLTRARGNKVLIVVDEAQNLSPATLEGLRLLTNLGQPEGQAVQLVLVGQPDLEQNIRRPELAQLRQRIRVHYRLETLGRQETEAYVAHRLKVAGAERPLFRPQAIELIHRASAGVPRLVNILCSRALLSAFVAGKREVGVEHVDLEDLPPATGVTEAVAPAGTAPAPARTALRRDEPAPPPVRQASPVPDRPAAQAPEPRPAADRVAPAPSASPPPPSPPPPSSPPDAPAHAPRPAAAPDAPRAKQAETTAAPFEPMVAYRRRRGRGGIWFVFALLLLVLAAVIVFSLRPVDSAPAARPAQAAPGSAARPAPAVQPPEPTGGAASTPSGAQTVAPDSLAAVPAAAAEPDTSAARAVPASAAAISRDPPGGATPDASSPAPAAAVRAPGVWAIHVHSFQDMTRTDSDIARFRKAGLPAFYRTAVVEGLEWQRVYVGPYRTIEEAREVEARLRDARLTSYAQIVRLGDGSS